MSKDKLTMELPQGYVNALSRRHHGAPHIKSEIEETYKRMQHLYKGYCRNRKRLDWILNVFWDKQEIERYYGTKRFYLAHKRLRYARENMEKFHRYLFATLTSFDGNSGQEYSQTGVISADEIMDDFKKEIHY